MPRGGKRVGAGRKANRQALTPARLGAAILKASGLGDRSLLEGLARQMVDIAIGKAAGCSPAASVGAFTWFAARDVGLLDELVRRLLSQRTEILVDVVEHRWEETP